MARLIFKASDVLKVAMHSVKNQQREIADWATANEANGFTPKREVPKEPHVILVHDQGVYLMSNGNHGEGKTPSTERLIAYAKGCHPDKDKDWYDNARDLVGGDDFADYLPWARELAVAAQQKKEIVIEITAESMELVR